MAILIECPNCRYRNSENKGTCKRCGLDLKKAKRKIFWIEYYFCGQRKREKIGPWRRLAEEALAKRKLEIAEGRFLDKVKEKKVDFSVFAKEYLRYSKENKSQTTYRRDLTIINTHLIPYFKGKLLNEITERDIESYRTKRLEEGVKPSTTNREIDTIKAMFNKATRWGYIRSNPAKGVRKRKVARRHPRFLTLEEIERLLSACDEPLYTFVLIGLYTGMRKSEILHLRWEDIDFKNRLILVNNSDEFHTKNYEPRAIPMHPTLYEHLRRIPRNINSDYLFCHSDGERIKDLKKGFSLALKRAGIKDFTVHGLRHTFASHMVMAGCDLLTLQRILGHKSLDMVRIYAHLTKEHTRMWVERVYMESDGHLYGHQAILGSSKTKSGRQDLNLRPQRPERCALPG